MSRKPAPGARSLQTVSDSPARWERITILLLCLLAAARVFLFSAAFPFFSNIDEERHFDLVMRYARGQVPQSYEPFAKESLDMIVLYGSPEFNLTPQTFPEGKFPSPLWKQSAADREPELRVTEEVWKKEINFEASQPPVYYWLAAAWLWLGRAVGLAGLTSLYWLRFLNIPLQVAVIWLGYAASQMIFPGRASMRVGVPMLLAFIPQDTFYSVENDVLSPLCFGFVFVCVLRWLRGNGLGVGFAALSGLAIALTYLVKLSNLPLLAVALAATSAVLLSRSKDLSSRFAITAVFLFCALMPIGLCVLWTKQHFGDVTGSADKIAILDWTRKSITEWWHHPIFSPAGLWTFLSDLLASFWRGEFTWQRQPLRNGAADLFYAISSISFVIAAIISAGRQRNGLGSFQRKSIWLAIVTFLAAIAFLGFLSIQFDFGKCPNPSRDHPYFTSGRLISGALIPFAVVYVFGLDRLLRRAQSGQLTLFVLALIVTAITASEWYVNRVAFSSEHNLFHL